jgi:hypothetical protein
MWKGRKKSSGGIKRKERIVSRSQATFAHKNNMYVHSPFTNLRVE